MLLQFRVVIVGVYEDISLLLRGCVNYILRLRDFRNSMIIDVDSWIHLPAFVLLMNL